MSEGLLWCGDIISNSLVPTSSVVTRAKVCNNSYYQQSTNRNILDCGQILLFGVHIGDHWLQIVKTPHATAEIRHSNLAETLACSTGLEMVLKITCTKSKVCLHCCKKFGRVKKGANVFPPTEKRSRRPCIKLLWNAVSRIGPLSITSRLSPPNDCKLI